MVLAHLPRLVIGRLRVAACHHEGISILLSLCTQLYKDCVTMLVGALKGGKPHHSFYTVKCWRNVVYFGLVVNEAALEINSLGG